MAIKISLAQLKSGPELIYTVLRTTARWELAPWDLRFDVTEATLAQTKWTHNDALPRLRELGVTIAIDDFGVGMQSFERLKDLPVDVIKIDGSFIRNVTQRGKDYALVQASAAVARAFGAQTVAEFVQDEETVVCLRELDIDWIQGYLVSQPEPLGEVLARLN